MAEKKTEKKEQKNISKKTGNTTPFMFDLLKKPVITEKATKVSENNQVVFKVAKQATKPLVKKAIENIYGVKVKSVNILNYEGKRKLFKRSPGQRADYKKAYITLAEGENLDFMETK